MPGTTRDRHFGDAEWNGRRFWIVDTGGLVPDSNEAMDKAIRRQVEFALAESDLVLFLVDGPEGLTPVDRAIAERLRRAERPVLLAVNKLDDLERSTAQYDFYQLGFGDPIGVSAAVGKGSGDLLDAVVAKLPPRQAGEDADAINVAVVGRPNVGKSSLVNRLLGEERHVVAPEAGTTRDAIDSVLRFDGKTLNFIDTAGLRKRTKVEDDIEFYSTLRTERAVERADVCVLVVDASLGLHAQDLRIASDAWERGRGLIVVVNKWDLVEEKDANTAHRGQEQITERVPFLRYVPFLYASAFTGQRVRKLLELILEVAEQRQARVPTAEVNRVLESLIERTAPPQQPGEEVKLLYASQIGTAPPTFAIVTNRPDDVPESYQRYLDARLPERVAVHRLAGPAQAHAARSAPAVTAAIGWLALSYLMGAFPTSWLAARLFRGIDLREYGSRNLGATNVYRVLGWKYAIPVGAGGHAEGRGAGLAFGPRLPEIPLFPLLCGLAAVVGPRVLGLRRLQGRQGCGDGQPGSCWRSRHGRMLAVTVVWALLVWLTGYVSLASIVAASLFPLAAWLLHDARGAALLADIALAAFLVWKHRSNLRRLLAGN